LWHVQALSVGTTSFEIRHIKFLLTFPVTTPVAYRRIATYCGWFFLFSFMWCFDALLGFNYFKLFSIKIGYIKCFIFLVFSAKLKSRRCAEFLYQLSPINIIIINVIQYLRFLSCLCSSSRKTFLL
jgi:hypothetical protein